MNRKSQVLHLRGGQTSCPTLSHLMRAPACAVGISTAGAADLAQGGISTAGGLARDGITTANNAAQGGISTAGGIAQGAISAARTAGSASVGVNGRRHLLGEGLA